MSQTLTQYYKNYSFARKTNRAKIFSWALLVLIAMIMLIVSVSISLSKSKEFSAKHFYFVYAGKYTISSMAQEVSTKVSDLGGAGVIYKIGNTKFVVASVYFSESDAKTVKNNMIGNFAETDVIKVSAPKLSKSVANKIQKQNTCKRYYSLLYYFCKSLYDWSNSYDKGELDVSQVYKNIMLQKQQFSDLSASLTTMSDSISEAMHSSSLVVIQQISSFFDSAFINNNVAKYIKKLYVNSIIEFVDMCENIK